MKGLKERKKEIILLTMTDGSFASRNIKGRKF